MVLGNDTNVLWYTPTTVTAAALSPSSPSSSLPFSAPPQALSSLNSGTGFLGGDSDKENRSRTTDDDNTLSQSALRKTSVPSPSTRQHWPLVYGPMFRPLPPGAQRKRRRNRLGHRPGSYALEQRHQVLEKQQQQQQYQGKLPCYPNDSRVVELSSSPPSFMFLQDETVYQESYSQSVCSVYEMYYEDMPLELLQNVFGNFLQISFESLTRLAEERTLARNRARRPSARSATAATSAFTTASRRQQQQHQEERCNNNNINSSRRRRNLQFSHQQHHHLSRSRRPRGRSQPYCSSGTVMSQHSSASAASSSSSSSGITAGQLSQHLGSLDLDGHDAIEVQSESTTDRGNTTDYGELSGQDSEDSIIDDSNDDITDCDDSNRGESEELDVLFRSETTSTLSLSLSSKASTEAITSWVSRTGRKEMSPTNHFKSDSQDTVCCQCHPRRREASPQHPRPRLGINRVDNDLDEEAMLYLLHRDQCFHPTTHTSLRSDLYRCSLVNRQWRIAALQLLWQSVVLDSESCRLEPISKSCSCSWRSRESSASTSSSSSTTPKATTRLETMLDSYLEIYGLDLAKCVHTVELDLRLLVWSADVESIRRVLKRLSPFAHLRLIWAEKESAEEMTTGFKAAMEGLHGPVRHLHFSPGFVLSRDWTQEMVYMTRLEHLTLERLGTMEIMCFDWSRIKHFTLHAAIPMNLFQYPPPPSLHPPIASTQSHTDEATAAAPFTGASSLNPQHPSHYNAIAPSTVAGAPLIDQLFSYSTAASLALTGVSQQTSVPPTPGPLQSQPNVHPQRSPSGWWRWAHLTHLEVVIKGSILPCQWLSDLTDAISEQGDLVRKLLQCQSPSSHNASTVAKSPSLVAPLRIPSATVEGRLLSYGPPLKVLRLDCPISHPHRDIFMDLISAWGPFLEEFHCQHSGELTDDFFWLCLRKMTRLRRLSLRDSRGITGEGIDCCNTNNSLSSSKEPPKSPILSSMKESATTVAAKLQQQPSSSPSLSSSSSSSPSSSSSTESTPKAVEAPILWSSDFCELRLDQSRVRREFLEALKVKCPSVRYSVREVRWR